MTPSVWIYTQYGEALVNLSIKNKYLEQFVDYGSFQVFQDATTYTAIQIFSKKDKNYIDYVFA
ncbi:MAG: hypothetical protein B6229_03670 [Spirochaetaceae bacterium 4572_7]|nr:MAG: hypothetical protein B6229_03670 [Spirochaetaceae bacterium 4572_7]